MKLTDMILKAIRQTVISGNPFETENAMKHLDMDEEDAAAIMDALTAGLHDARKRLADSSMTVAEFLLNIDAFNTGVGMIKQKFQPDKNRLRAVVGVVEGDVHTLGATLVAGVMDALGYEVTLLGQGTEPDLFIKALRETGASLLGLSSMMTTTLSSMKRTLDLVRRELPDVKILVGGAALDAELAETLHADGYAFSVVDLPDVLEKIVSTEGKKGRSSRKYTDYERKLHVIETADS